MMKWVLTKTATTTDIGRKGCTVIFQWLAGLTMRSVFSRLHSCSLQPKLSLKLLVFHSSPFSRWVSLSLYSTDKNHNLLFKTLPAANQFNCHSSVHLISHQQLALVLIQIPKLSFNSQWNLTSLNHILHCIPRLTPYLFVISLSRSVMDVQIQQIADFWRGTSTITASQPTLCELDWQT